MEFSNALFQEHLAALALSKMDFDQIISFISVGKKIKKLNTKWIQTVASLLSLLDEANPKFKNLLKFLEDDNIELLFTTEKTKYSEPQRVAILKKLLQRVGLTGQSTRNKSNVAAQFRMPGFPYVLVTTDIFREGEDLHTYCQNIYHYGIAWNCSDMEQRTGRIDRINSISHRKMSHSGSVNFDERVHVFYPYLQQTLEVNQVSKLFRSINRFIETFNDFTKPIKEDGIASAGERIEDMLPVIETPLHSKFEYHYFKGYDEGGHFLSSKECIGTQHETLDLILKNLTFALMESGEQYYYGPYLNSESWNIKGDMIIKNRRGRRGPFIIQLRNDICSGKFVIEVMSHLYKISTKVQKLNTELINEYGTQYRIASVHESRDTHTYECSYRLFLSTNAKCEAGPNYISHKLKVLRRTSSFLDQ